MSTVKPYKILAVLCATSLLGACTGVSRKQPDANPRPTIASEAQRPEPPQQALTEQLLYQMLLAEIAMQRGDTQLAVRAYLDLMKQTNDYRIAERTTQLALNARMADEALLAAERWLVLEPASIGARQTVAGMLVTKGRLAEARPHLETILAAEKANLGNGFLHLNNLLARHSNKTATLGLVQELAQPYPQLAEAHFAVARAAWSAGEKALAVKASTDALALRPDWEGAALFKAQVLHSIAAAQAVDYYTAYLRGYPQAREMRLSYARLLVQEKQFGPAREEFKRLIADFPNNPEVPLAIGLISMQLQEYDAAETYLTQALAAGVKDEDAVRFYLGQLSEERKRWIDAKRWYEAVGGSQAFAAQLRIAGLLARQGDLPAARTHLQKMTVTTNQQRAQVAAAESSLLRDAKQLKEAFEVLNKALEKLPNHPELLYDHAMAAEKIDRIDVMEVSLKKLIQVKPDHAHAYNALGYTLADRTTRYEEAKQYLEQALKLAPDDAYILDSMGWLQYRMKNYSQAIVTLRQALSVRADPEIAAHLGEVLWAAGQKDEAQKVWDSALKDNPGHEALTGTVHKFKAK